MSSYNPAAKAGYTRTGKSLKAVRRYYALLNEKKARTADEDKLSKRIAAELKTQQDANEKRSRREVPQQPLLGSEVPTERSDLPKLMVSGKETGPVFIAPVPPPPPPPPPQPLPPAQESAAKSPANKSAGNQDNQYAKTIRSFKSTRSVGALPGTPEGMCGARCLFFILGLMLGVLIGIPGYILVQKLMHRDESSNASPRSWPPY